MEQTFNAEKIRKQATQFYRFRYRRLFNRFFSSDLSSFC